jgi:hypothetical protein
MKKINLENGKTILVNTTGIKIIETFQGKNVNAKGERDYYISILYFNDPVPVTIGGFSLYSLANDAIDLITSK